LAKYDINDPTDLDIMRAQFDMITHDEWEEYIELATDQNIGYKNLNIIKSASRKAGISKYLSPKVINWVLSIVDQIEENLDEEE
jgi:exodeoxyribonuclease V alpha subunit